LLNVRDQVLYQYKTGGKITVLYILIFTFIDSRGEPNDIYTTSFIFFQNSSNNRQFRRTCLLIIQEVVATYKFSDWTDNKMETENHQPFSLKLKAYLVINAVKPLHNFPKYRVLLSVSQSVSESVGWLVCQLHGV
jgi:hypothetical protein